MCFVLLSVLFVFYLNRSTNFVVCRAHADVEAAGNELAGAEAGDGRDASNRSLQERLAAAQNDQVS